MNISYGYSNVYDTISFFVTHEYGVTLESGSEYEIKRLIMKRYFPDDTNIIWTDAKPDQIKYAVVCNVSENLLSVAIHEKTSNGDAVHNDVIKLERIE